MLPFAEVPAAAVVFVGVGSVDGCSKGFLFCFLRAFFFKYIFLLHYHDLLP